VISRRTLSAVAAPVLAIAVLAGCTESPSIASAGNNTGYASGDGVYKEIKPAHRGKPVSYTDQSDQGTTVSSSQFLGKVTVLNFWYAGCGPCIAEAPRLESVYKHYKGAVPFLGVNTYDAASTINTFDSKYHVTYPSAVDAKTVNVQFAFSSSVPPDARPTTLVIDRHGRVAARVLGEIESPSILIALIDTVKAEGK
jgi:thiol-disulfide isomerase/thioredoxin